MDMNELKKEYEGMTYEKFVSLMKTIEELKKSLSSYEEEEEEEGEEFEITDSEEEEEQDCSEVVEGWDKNYGTIDGETLKIMDMGKYFKKCDIDEDKIYYITFYSNEEEMRKNIPGWMSECYFSIEDLSDKVFYVYYNTSSRFAYEQENIYFEDSEEESEDESVKEEFLSKLCEVLNKK